ncbi:MAG: hydantoinase/oxoprolinase family protein [Ilumatobacteraceae bacterium]
MNLSLGIDTGGTYTDAVVFDDERGVVAKAKALTTRHDLAIGIAEAVETVVGRAGIEASQIGLVSLSTTLATNALVEGRGGRVGLVFIGFDEGAEQRGGLFKALNGDPLIRIAGGHNPQGDSVSLLDLDSLQSQALAVADGVSGFAVTAQFATRNPEHEIAARDLLIATTGLPVTCGHELSAKLDGPRRALTSVLNARLIGLITGLIAAATDIMQRHGIEAPLMVVRGDGALMSAEMAMTRPIETILSGPAASLVGAAYLTGARDAIVSDIGGTTSDVAVVQGGAPHLDESGATVGGFRTMVEAVGMTTIGLGGDSEVCVVGRIAQPTLSLGPRRLVPICLAAAQYPSIVHRALDQQLLNDAPGDQDARFVLPITDSGASDVGLEPAELSLLQRARDGATPVSWLVHGHADVRRLDRLVSRGLLMLSGFTPTDASHVTGDHVAFDRDASIKAATLMARKRSALGKPVADGAETMSEWVISALQRRSAELVMDVALRIDGFDPGISRHPLVAASLDDRVGIVDVSARLTVALVGLGASAGIYYPTVAKLLRAEGIIPADADVANAIGAVVGQVRVHTAIYVSQPERGEYRVHHLSTPDDFDTMEEAFAAAERIASVDALNNAETAGAAEPDVTVRQVINIANMDGEDYLVDATITATASGRPRANYR